VIGFCYKFKRPISPKCFRFSLEAFDESEGLIDFAISLMHHGKIKTCSLGEQLKY